MFRNAVALLLIGAVVSSGGAQDKKDPPKKDPPRKAAPSVFTNAEEAGPEFKIQGEYEGKIGEFKFGAQVVALGDGKFDVCFLPGGLSGAGWDGKTKLTVPALTEESKVVLKNKWNGTIGDSKLSGKNPDDVAFMLKQVLRKSPTEGATPPEGAMILFDGKNADQWNGGKIVEENLLLRGVNSKKGITVGRLHLEFRTPFQPKARGQGRGNSGVYLHGAEIQVLDSFGLKGENNECGGFYGHRKPDVNMCFPPLSWQTYDVDIKVDGENIVATVLHNGVKIHENFTLKKGALKPATINLQDHGNPVVYRNIWFAEMK